MARRIVAEFDAINGPFLRKLGAIDKRLAGWERNSTASLVRVEKGIDSVAASAARLNAVGTAVAAGLGSGFAARLTDDAKIIRKTLREAGDASEETFENVFRASVRSLAGFKSFTQEVQLFQKALAGQQELDETIRQVETLNKLLSLSGRTTAERQSTSTQFSQALQSGVLQGDELRSLRENAPIELTRAIAAEAGGTIQDLKELGAQGKLTTDVMIRALKRLESEADRRFSNVQVTIQDASNVFASGAIIAVEGLDNGLGASDATISALMTLGEALGGSGEAFERFGRAAQIAGAVLVASFAGRRIQRTGANLQAMVKASEASAKAAREAADDEATAIERKLPKLKEEIELARQKRLVAIQARDALEAEGASALKVQEANRKLLESDKKVMNARRRHADAINEMTLAHSRFRVSARTLTTSSRALAAAGRAMSTSFAFLGGVPGLLLTAAAVFATLYSRAESTADAVDRLADSNAAVESQISNMTALVQALRQAEKERADGAIEASERIITATKQEYEVRRAQLKITNDEVVAAQIERADQLDKLAEDRENLLRQIADQQSTLDQMIGQEFDSFGNTRTGVNDNLTDLYEQLQEVESQTLRLEAAFGEADIQLSKAADALAVTFEELADASKVAGAQEILKKFLEETTTALDRQRTKIAQVEEAERTLVKAVADKVITLDAAAVSLDGLGAAMDRYRSEMDSSRRKTDDLTNAAIRLRDAMAGIGEANVSLQGRLRIAEAQLKAAQGGASQNEVNAIGEARRRADEAIAAGASPDKVAAIYQETLKLNGALSETQDKINSILNPKKSSGGGRGTSTLKQIEQEATSFIASMRTEEERRAVQLAEVVRLRQQLLNIYGQETEMTRDLSEAIRRMQDETSIATMAAETLGDALATGLSQAIAEGERFEDVMRRVIARLIEAEGVDFFTTLLGGSTGGNSLGALAADWITSSVFHKGTDNVGSGGMTRRMPAWAFAGAPRFHDGLFKPGEYPAILERGEQVIPAGMSIGGGPSVNIHNHNDFTGAQAAAVAQLEAAVMRLEAAIPGLALDAVRQAGRTRTKL